MKLISRILPIIFLPLLAFSCGQDNCKDYENQAACEQTANNSLSTQVQNSHIQPTL
jgi:hypothetical protein